MSLYVVIELPDRGNVQTVVQSLESYKVGLRAIIIRSNRRLATSEARYDEDTPSCTFPIRRCTLGHTLPGPVMGGKRCQRDTFLVGNDYSSLLCPTPISDVHR
jgi:hypothetical protein